IQVPQQGGQFFQQAAQSQPFKAQQQTMEQTEHHILPGSTMPQSGQDKDDYQVPAGTGQTAAAAAQGNVQVIPEPAGQRNMPAAPVFAHALGQVGIIEVFGQFQTKEAADADGHIAVTGKVKIQLQHVGNVAQHQNGGRQRFGRDGNNPLIDQCQLVCNQGFFGKAKDKPFDA